MYSFYLDETLLPVTPSKLQLKIKGNNKTLSLANEREINFLRQPGLTEISFDMTLPMLQQYSFAYDFKRPDYYLSKLEMLMSQKKPFRFIVSRVSPSGALLFDSNMQVSLESYNVTEDASKGLDITVSINLKQFISFATKTGTIISDKTGDTLILSGSQRETANSPAAPTYMVKENDTPYIIAKKALGSGDKLPELVRMNPAAFPNLWSIKQGEVLMLK